MRGAHRFRGLLAAVVIAVLAGSRAGDARVTSEFPQPDVDDSARPNGMHTQAVPEVRGPGHVTTTSRLWLKTTNIGLMGNAFPTLSSDPSAQWPGSSGVEHLFYWGLWVGAAIPGVPASQGRYRVTSSIEWRPASLDPAEKIYENTIGTPGSLRWVDDDEDGKYDEDPQNGRDDDGDGKVDEDFAAPGDRTFSLEMRDDSEQSLYSNAAEPHVPLGIRVRQTVQSFQAKEATDFVGTTYEISNVSDRALDSVYVGFLVDQDLGPVSRQGYWRDDLPEPRVPSADYQEILTPADPRYDAHFDPNHPTGFCTRTSYRVRGFTMTDDDGDDGQTPGASTFLLLDHTMDARGVDAPRRLGFRSFHLYRPGTAFAQGGTPTLDIERYEAMADPSGVSDGAPALPRPDEDQRNDWSTLCSVGPFRRLEPGQTVKVTVALGVWTIDYSEPASPIGDPDSPNPKRYQAVLDGASAAQRFFRGQFETPPPGTLVPPANGRETYIVAPPDRELVIEDCHYNPDSSGAGFAIPPGGSAWFNIGCDYCDAVKGKAAKNWIVPGTPPGPELSIAPGDHRVRLAWNNRSEAVPDRSLSGLNPDAGKFQFWGYRIYRAAGYTRPVGSTGPVDAQWELLADLRHYDALEPLIDSLDTNGDGRPDTVRFTPDVLLDRETGQRYPARDVPQAIDPLTGEPEFVTGVRTYFDQGCHCNRTQSNYQVPVYTVGRYVYDDPEVLNGFVYFYTITAVDSSGAAGSDGTPGTLLMREGRKFAVEGDGVVPHSSVSQSGDGGIIVVPNPYRGHAAWDLTPSPADPTGAHVDFLHMPPGPWTLRIFTISGDLVDLIRSDDTQPNGRPQQESPDDGQASWNLLSRNGQDVASGIYLYSVEAPSMNARGKFVIIR